MLTTEEHDDRPMIRTTGPADISAQLIAKAKAFKVKNGRAPNTTETRAIGDEVGLFTRTSAAPPVAPAAPPPVAKAPALPDHYREPEPMTSEERAKTFHARTKELRAEGVESMRAAKLAFRYAYGDQVPASDLVGDKRVPPTMTAADEADRDARFRALIKEKKEAGKHPNVARSEAFHAVYGDLYAK